MKKFSYITYIGLTLITGIAYADCGATHIIITNATQSLCKLKDYDLRHGYLDYVSIVPAYILPNSTGHTTALNPSFIGAELKLTYLCGNEEVTLVTRSKYHLFVAGKIDAQAYASKNITVEFFIMPGNCLWSEHGSIQWLIK